MCCDYRSEKNGKLKSKIISYNYVPKVYDVPFTIHGDNEDPYIILVCNKCESDVEISATPSNEEENWTIECCNTTIKLTHTCEHPKWDYKIIENIK